MIEVWIPGIGSDGVGETLEGSGPTQLPPLFWRIRL